MSCEFDLTGRNEVNHLNFSSGKMYYTDTSTWVAPVVEVWLTWKAVASPTTPEASGHQAHEHNKQAHLDAHAPSESAVIEHRHLLGLAKFSSDYKLGTLVALPVVDVTRGVQRGVLVTAAVLGREEDLVENSLQCLLNFYSLRGSAVPEGVAEPDVDKVEPLSVPQEQQVQQGEEESKQDFLHDQADEEEDESTHRETDVDHDVINDTNDSIGDIITFLNDHHDLKHGPKRSSNPLAASTGSMKEFLAQESHAAGVNEVSPTSVPNSHSVEVAEPEVIPSANAKLRQDLGQRRLHLLDFSVDKEFSAVRPVHEAYTPANIFGCYVKYTLPDLRGVSDPENYALWWDGDCAVLNGSLRHQVELPVEDDRQQESVHEAALGEALGLSACVKFFFYLADAEGNVPLNPVVFGEAALSLSALAQFMSNNTGFTVFELPISLHHAELSRLQAGFEVVQNNPIFLLKVSHRIEPVLLRRSRDPTHYSVQPPLPAPMRKQENISPGVSMEQPAWRVRYSNDPHKKEEGEGPGQVAEQLNHESHLSASASASHTSHDISTHRRTDAASRLLGFELTQEDLDGILYFRDPTAPLPWVPFEGSPLLEDPRRRAVLTSALGGMAITTKAKDEEVDLDAALQKSIYELEYIDNMFHRRAETDALPATNQSEHVPSLHVNDANQGTDDDTEMYKSDFESLDDETNVDMITKSIERDHVVSQTSTGKRPPRAPPVNLEESVESDNSQYFSDGPPVDELESDSDLEDGASSVASSLSAAEASICKRVAALKSLVSDHFNPARDAEKVEESERSSIREEVSNAPVAPLQLSKEIEDDASRLKALDMGEREEEYSSKDEEGQDEGTNDHNLFFSARSDEASDSPEMRDLDEEVPSLSIQEFNRSGEEEEDMQTGDERQESSTSDLDSLQVSSMELAVAELNSHATGQEASDEPVPADLVAEDSRLRFDSPENVVFVDEVVTPCVQREEEEEPMQQQEDEEIEDVEAAEELRQRDSEANESVMLAEQDAEAHQVEESTQTDLRELSLDMDFTLDLVVSEVADTSAQSAQSAESAHSALSADSVVQDTSAAASASTTRDQDISQTGRADASHDASIAHYSMHMSLHADPDTLKMRSSTESIPGSAVADEEEPYRMAQNHSKEHLNESSASARSATSVTSAAASVQSMSKVSCNSSTADDSPDTSKIKNIVDKQIEKYFGPDVLLPHPPSDGSFSHLSNLHSSASLSHARGVDPQVVHQWHHRTDHLTFTAPATAAPVAPAAPVKPPTEAELFRANLSKVQSLLPVSLGSTKKRRHPGWQGRFLDKETDRASNIMNGVFSKSDHV